MTTKQEQDIIDFAGSADTLEDALSRWEQERETIADLFDENQAFEIHLRQLDAALTLASNLIEQIETEAAMFLSKKARNKIDQFRSLIKDEDKRRAEVKQLIAERKEKQT